jgi:thioredoxin reductase
MSHHDVTIIGGSAAGLSAALVLSRAGRTFLVIDAGNVIDPRAQVITAAGAGSAAAIALNADLVDDDVRRAVLEFDNGLQRRPTTNAHPKETP